MNYCQRCGAKRQEGEKFCGSCGSKFEVITAQPPTNDPPATADEQQIPRYVSADQPETEQSAQPSSEAAVNDSTQAPSAQHIEQTREPQQSTPPTLDMPMSHPPQQPIPPSPPLAADAQVPQAQGQPAQSAEQPPSAQYQPPQFVRPDPVQAAQPITQNEEPAAAQFTVHKKKGIRKLVWIPIVVIVLLAALGATGWFLGSKYSSADYAVERLEKAVEDRDTKELLKLLVSEDDEWKLDEKQAKSFIEALKEHKDFRKELYASLRKQAASGEGSTKINVFKSTGGSSEEAVNFLTLKKDGKQWMFFDRYVFEVQPFYMELSTNLEGAVISINGKEIATADEDDYEKKVGPLMPGIYEVTAEIDTEYGPLETTQEVELFSNSVQTVDLFLNADYVMIYSDAADAILWANEQEIGPIPLDGLMIGPLATDGSVTVKAIKDFEWGTVESEEYVIDYAGDVYLELDPLTEDLKSEIYTTVNEFAATWLQGYAQLNAGLMKNISNDLKEYFQQDMNEMTNQGILVAGTAESTVYDADSFYYYFDDEDSGALNIAVDLSLHTLTSVYYQEEEPILEEVDYAWTVYLIRDSASGKWVIEDIADLDASSFYPYEPVEFDLPGI